MTKIQSIFLSEKRGYLTIILEQMNGERILLRRTENLREWCHVLENLVKMNQEMVMQTSEQFWSKSMNNERNRALPLVASLDRNKKRSSGCKLEESK